MVLEKSQALWLCENNNYFENYFEELRYYLNPLFQYKQGNCHNIAHFASLILKNYGVAHKKIWIYAPTRFDENSKQTIKLPDPNNISPKGILTWGFHVALLIQHEKQEFVFDFFIDEEKPMTVGDWLDAMKIKNFKVEIENPENYLFFTKESEKKKNGLFSGKYFEYEGFCRQNEWIPKGLAINETALEFYKKEFYHFHYKTPLSSDYRLFVGRVNNFECVIRDCSENKKMTLSFQKKHAAIIAEYRLIYEENLIKWRNWVNAFL
jgi:hypothetical protein